MTGVVIVGGGQAGCQCAENLRLEGYDGPITLVGEERHLPYQRPPLSKDYLLGKTTAERILYRPRQFYDQNAVALRLHESATAIDTRRKTVQLSGGDSLSWHALVLATGARVQKMPVAGADADGVCYLRTLDDVDDIGQRLEKTEQVVVVGGGFIGLEFAAVARRLGRQVQVFETMERVMARVVAPEISHYFTRLHESHGVEIHCATSLAEIVEEGGRLKGVRTRQGHFVAADLVVAGIGVVPNTQLASKAGLDCDNGIVVDAFGRTSHQDIYACGDCAVYEHPFAARRIRLESVQNAADQARAVAASINGLEKPYKSVPWFWSDQYDVKLQMAGLAIGCDYHLVRGDMNSDSFSLLHFRGEELRAIEAVNAPRDYIVGRMLLEKGVSPSRQQAADKEFNLKSLLV